MLTDMQLRALKPAKKIYKIADQREGFDRDDPVPFVPDLCVEVLLDSDRICDIDRRVAAYLEGGAAEVIIIGPVIVDFICAGINCTSFYTYMKGA
ncbi:Uma2 family endonuclease [Paraburkholderia lacunae]|uniref:Uma2 family endonuclease n=1 Tax=Paraburkholderia lacunae TaxID=2211104 RepID=UPI001FCBA8E5|nr:Uma2 family endonuclease [Paraburkholderia lacunae]